MVESLPKVSIVLPTYNGSKYLRQAIDSCLNQTHRNIELVIVDDGSTDETPVIIKSYKDKRIEHVKHKENMGLPEALNTGFSNATGDYLTWTSDDNQYMPSAIEEMLNYLQKNQDVDFVYADYWAHHFETSKKELRKLPDHLALHRTNEVGPCFLFTREVYEKIGNYNSKLELVEDYDYWIRVSKRFKMGRYPLPLYIYGEHRGSLKGTKPLNIELFDHVLRFRHGYLSQKDLGNALLRFFVLVWKSPKLRNEKLSLCISAVGEMLRLSILLGLSGLASVVPVFIEKSFKKVLTRVFFYGEYLISPFKLRRCCSSLKAPSQKQNILCIIPYMVAGGSERVILNMVKGIESNRFAFHVITTEPASHPWRQKFQGPFENVVIPLRRAGDEAICYTYFCELIRQLRIRILVISNSIVGYRCVAKLKKSFPAVKVIDILHSEEGWGTRPELREVVPFLDRRICISYFLENFVKSRYQEAGIPDSLSSRLVTVYNGIDLTEYRRDGISKGRFRSLFQIPLETRIISFIGRFDEEKNPFLFLEVAKNLLSKYAQEKIKFVMAGDGSELGEMKRRIETEGLRDFLLLPGMLDRPAELLADTDILLLVSRTEGIPLVILEALAMGVPVVSSQVGAVSEVIEDNVTGFLVHPEDDMVEQFTTKILKVLSAREDAARIADKGRQRIFAEHSLEVMGERYQRIFEEITNL